MADIGIENKDDSKGLDFEFKSTKGSKVKIHYDPSGTIKVSDKKAFEGHLKKVADSFEIVEKKDEDKDKPKPKTLEVVAEESEDKSDET